MSAVGYSGSLDAQADVARRRHYDALELFMAAQNDHGVCAICRWPVDGAMEPWSIAVLDDVFHRHCYQWMRDKAAER